MNLLEIDILNKTYSNGTHTLEDIKLTAKEGEFVALVGPSGCGKSTLLKLVAGIDQEVQGEISFNGQLKRTSDSIAQSPAIGYMFQESRLMPWLTVRQNIQMVIGEQSDSSTTYLTELLHQVGLNEFVNYYPKQLSGGMKRRASLVRAFINRPALLLMDEPFQSLDEPTADTLRDILLGLWRETKPTVLFVTHTMREALALADRVVFLSDRPARIIFEHDVAIERPRKLEDEAINQLHSELLNKYPQLLAGSLTKSAEAK